MRILFQTRVPDDFNNLRVRMNNRDLSTEYMQGVIDGTLLSFFDTYHRRQFWEALNELNGFVSSWHAFLNEGLGGSSAANADEVSDP